jgi:Ran GTPase-activating protein (RanGAP) involved in mRNA processing and transport
MGDEGIIALCEGLSSTNGALLHHLDLGWKQITKDGLYTIGKTFVHSKYLTHLDLSRNEFGSDGVAQLSRAVVEATNNNHNVDGAAYDDDLHNNVAFPALEQLILSECTIDSTGMGVLADILLGRDNNDKRRRSNNIHLAIGSNPIGSKGCEALTRLLSSNDAGVGSIIRHLQAIQCSIGDEGIRILSGCCHDNLEILDISDNDISYGGAEQLAKSLCHSWPDLVELKIAKNDIGSDGVMAILGSMVTTRSDKDNNSTEKNDKINTLDISYTNCGADGARAALMSGGVSTLRLFGNKIGSEGFQAIAPLLRGGHPNIENLDLGGNNADEDSVVILLDAIAETSDDSPDSRLVVLEIGGNKFGENAMEALNRVKSVWPDLDVAHDKPVGESEWKEEG